MRSSSKKASYIRLITVALLIAAVLMAVGVAFARYRSTANSVGTVTMEYNYASDSVHILAAKEDGNGMTGEPIAETNGKYKLPEGWSYVSSGNSIYSLSFLLSNTDEEKEHAAFDQYGYIEVFVTEGFSGDATIQLESGSMIYTGTPYTVEEGSSLYTAYGPGRVFRFANRSGEIASWFLSGDSAAFVPMTVTIWGTSSDPAAFTIIATGTPFEK